MIRIFSRDTRGHTAIEYAMIAAVGALAIIASLSSMGASANGMFTALLDGWNAAAAQNGG